MLWSVISLVLPRLVHFFGRRALNKYLAAPLQPAQIACSVTDGVLALTLTRLVFDPDRINALLAEESAQAGQPLRLRLLSAAVARLALSLPLPGSAALAAGTRPLLTLTGVRSEVELATETPESNLLGLGAARLLARLSRPAMRRALQSALADMRGADDEEGRKMMTDLLSVIHTDSNSNSSGGAGAGSGNSSGASAGEEDEDEDEDGDGDGVKAAMRNSRRGGDSEAGVLPRLAKAIFKQATRATCTVKDIVAIVRVPSPRDLVPVNNTPSGPQGTAAKPASASAATAAPQLLQHGPAAPLLGAGAALAASAPAPSQSARAPDGCAVRVALTSVTVRDPSAQSRRRGQARGSGADDNGGDSDSGSDDDDDDDDTAIRSYSKALELGRVTVSMASLTRTPHRVVWCYKRRPQQQQPQQQSAANSNVNAASVTPIVTPVPSAPVTQQANLNASVGGGMRIGNRPSLSASTAYTASSPAAAPVSVVTSPPAVASTNSSASASTTQTQSRSALVVSRRSETVGGQWVMSPFRTVLVFDSPLSQQKQQQHPGAAVNADTITVDLRLPNPHVMLAQDIIAAHIRNSSSNNGKSSKTKTDGESANAAVIDVVDSDPAAEGVNSTATDNNGSALHAAHVAARKRAQAQSKLRWARKVMARAGDDPQAFEVRIAAAVPPVLAVLSPREVELTVAMLDRLKPPATAANVAHSQSSDPHQHTGAAAASVTLANAFDDAFSDPVSETDAMTVTAAASTTLPSARILPVVNFSLDLPWLEVRLLQENVPLAAEAKLRQNSKQAKQQQRQSELLAKTALALPNMVSTAVASQRPLGNGNSSGTESNVGPLSQLHAFVLTAYKTATTSVLARHVFAAAATNKTSAGGVKAQGTRRHRDAASINLMRATASARAIMGEAGHALSAAANNSAVMTTDKFLALFAARFPWAPSTDYVAVSVAGGAVLSQRVVCHRANANTDAANLNTTSAKASEPDIIGIRSALTLSLTALTVTESLAVSFYPVYPAKVPAATNKASAANTNAANGAKQGRFYARYHGLTAAITNSHTVSNPATAEFVGAKTETARVYRVPGPRRTLFTVDSSYTAANRARSHSLLSAAAPAHLHSAVPVSAHSSSANQGEVATVYAAWFSTSALALALAPRLVLTRTAVDATGVNASAAALSLECHRPAGGLARTVAPAAPRAAHWQPDRGLPAPTRAGAALMTHEHPADRLPLAAQRAPLRSTVAVLVRPVRVEFDVGLVDRIDSIIAAMDPVTDSAEREANANIA